MSMKEILAMVTIVLLLLGIGFFGGTQYAAQNQKDKEQDSMLQFLLQQMPNLKSMYGS